MTITFTILVVYETIVNDHYSLFYRSQSQVDDEVNAEIVDWATLQIEETHDDGGRIEIMSES